MNTDAYQRRAVYREAGEEPFHYPGQTLRRMTADKDPKPRTRIVYFSILGREPSSAESQ